MSYGLFTGISIQDGKVVAHGNSAPTIKTDDVTAFHVKVFALDEPEWHVEHCKRESAGDDLGDPWSVPCENTPEGYRPFADDDLVVVVGAATLRGSDIPFLWQGFFKIKPQDPHDHGEIHVGPI